MNDHAVTAKAFMDAIPEIERVEIEDSVKEHQIATANNLAVAALVLANRLDEAKALHAKHPLQQKKEAIFKQADWSSTTAFFFGVTSVFLDAASGATPDIRWKAVFEKDLDWNLTELQAIEVKSYQNFTLGLLESAEKGKEAGNAKLIAAAAERVNFFEKLSAANAESFPFPSLVDKIVISVGLAASVATGGPESVDLMLRGGEVLGRSLRQQLVEVASRLAHERGAEARRNVHAYFHLIGRKREWEADKLRQLLAKELPASIRERSSPSMVKPPRAGEIEETSMGQPARCPAHIVVDAGTSKQLGRA